MFMDWKNKHSKDFGSPQVDLFFVKIKRLIINFIWKGKGTRIKQF